MRMMTISYMNIMLRRMIREIKMKTLEVVRGRQVDTGVHLEKNKVDTYVSAH